MEKYEELFDLNNYLDDAEVCFSRMHNGELIGEFYHIPESICSRLDLDW